MNCDSNERGVSSPFICYRLSKSSLYIFTTGYANVTAYKKRACSPPIVANRGERLASSFLSVPPAFYMRKDEANTSPQIMPDTTQSLTSRLCRHIAPGRTRRRVQGRRKPLQKKHKIQLSPHIGNIALKYILCSVSQISVNVGFKDFEIVIEQDDIGAVTGFDFSDIGQMECL